MSANEFWQQLTRIGIVDAATCRAWIDRFQAIVIKRAAKAAEDKTPAQVPDATAVAQFLIANRLLTKFQSQRLLAGRASELRIGDYLVTDRCDQSPMSRWYRGRHMGTMSEGFIYPCTDALTSSRWVDPAWLNAHAAVVADGLQPITIVSLVASDPWRGAIVSPLPVGRSLDQWIVDQGQLDHATTAALGQMIANPLAEMHSAGLVHGEVRPSRVWCGEDRSLWLMRDAGRPPAHPADPPQEHRWFDDDSIAELYASPELADPNVEPTPSSDLFSLGSLLYELATGKKLQPAGTNDSLPPEVIAARDSGAAGDPLMRTLAFAIDPNPSARFADVQGFARALTAVVTAYESLPPLPEPSPTKIEPPAQAAVPTTKNEPPALAAGLFESTKISARPEASAYGSQVPQNQVETPPVESKPRQAVRAESPEAKAAVPKATKVVATPAPPVAQATVQTPEPKPEAVPTLVAQSPPIPKPAPVVAAPPVTAQSAPPPAPRRRKVRRPRRSRRGPIIIGGVAVSILIGILAIILRPSANSDRPRERPVPPPPRPPMVADVNPLPATPPPTAPATSSDPSGFELVADDRLLWSSPWSATSSPPSLEMLPPGPQSILTLRLGRIISDSAKSNWLDWLGPELRPTLAAFEKRSGIKPAQVDRLTITSLGGEAGVPKSTFTVTSREPIDVKALAKVWNASPSRTKEGKTIYAGDDPNADAYFVRDQPDTSGSGSTFVFGPLDLVSAVAENDGEAILLPRSLQQLWDTASVDADLVAIAIPNFLFADGREILLRYAAKAIDPLKSMLIPDVAGAIVSMGLVDHWYVETRLTPSGTVSAPSLLQTLQPRIQSLPAWAESFAIDANVDPSWRAMAIRLPQFMRAISDQTRFGVSKTIPTANFYLPAEAGPQVAVATILAMSAPDSGPVVATTTAPTMEPLTIEQMLEANLTVSFDQESLEFAITVIRDEFARSLPAGSTPPTITIVGGDLEKNGITQNQQIRNFQMRGKPLRDALTEIVRQANPDKTVTALTEAKQSLVWLVDPAAAPDKPTILITTRPAAATKKLTLPREFVAVK